MDLNQLLFHHQIALMQYSAQDSGRSRVGPRFDMVRHYETRIARLRKDMGVLAYPSWL